MWNQAPSNSLSPFEQVLLWAVMTCGEAHGGEIFEDASKLSETHINMGLMYLTLDDLEQRGLLQSRIKVGRPTRFYRLNAMGFRALEDATPNAKRLNEIFGELGKQSS